MGSFLIGLLILVGLIWLQINMSKKPNKWLGLIIPSIFLLMSIIPVVSLYLFSFEKVEGTTTNIEMTVDGEKGNIIESQPVEIQMGSSSGLQTAVMYLPIFLIGNIPTVIFLSIYFYFSDERKKKSELNKMSIQDL